MSVSPEVVLQGLLVAVTAALAGAFARLLRLPRMPVLFAFGALLAHGPGAVFDARAAAQLAPFVPAAMALAALTLGTRLRASGLLSPRAGGFATPALVTFALLVAVLGVVGGLPLATAALGALLLLPIVLVLPVGIRRHDRQRRAFDAAVLATAVVGAWALEGRGVGGRPPLAGLPLVLGALLAGVLLARACGGLLAKAEVLLDRAHGLALAVLGTLAGAQLEPGVLGAGLALALLAFAAGLLPRVLAGVLPTEAGMPRGRAALGRARAPRAAEPAREGLLAVGLVLLLRALPSLATHGALLLAITVCVATLRAVLGSRLVRPLAATAAQRR